MRLVGEKVEGVEIIVREQGSLRVIAQILVPQTDALRTLLGMLPFNAARTQLSGTDALPSPVSTATPAREGENLRIPDNPMQEAIAAYMDDLTRRRKASGTITQFSSVLRKTSARMGWREPGQIAYDGLREFIGAQETWGPASRARTMKIWSLFCQYLALTKRLPRDPLAGARGEANVEAPGSRAATVEEVRAILAEAATSAAHDKRAAKCDRAAYYLCLFAAGMRFGEPGKLKRKHIRLGAPVPHILWQSAAAAEDRTHKNNRTRAIALVPELAQVLSLWLAADDARRAREGLPPATPNTPLFESIPNGSTFQSDRRAAGIAELDFRERKFTPHSGRKFFATHLPSCGVHEKMVDFVMRHTGRTEYRYYDPSLEEQAAALSNFPRLLPDFYFAAKSPTSKGLQRGREKTDANSVASRPVIADTSSVTRSTTQGYTSQNLPHPIADSDDSPAQRVTALLSNVPESALGCGTHPANDAGTLTGVLRNTSSNSGFTIPETEVDAIANLLEALAKVIRASGARNEGRSSSADGKQVG